MRDLTNRSHQARPSFPSNEQNQGVNQNADRPACHADHSAHESLPLVPNGHRDRIARCPSGDRHVHLGGSSSRKHDPSTYRRHGIHHDVDDHRRAGRAPTTTPPGGSTGSTAKPNSAGERGI